MAKEIKVALVLDTKNFDKGIKSANSSMGQFKSKGMLAGGAMAGLAARLVPLAAGFLALKKSFDLISGSLAVSQKFEDIQIVLNNVTGSAEKGAIAMGIITEAAKELPFAFEDIASSAPALSTVSETLGDLEDNIKLAADIAGQFGIPFEVAASQLQRAFSAGAGAADVFREKGILSAAGFQAGVKVSIDDTIKKFKELGVGIEGAAQKLNNSFTGATSQAGDRLTQFRKAIGDAFRPELTALLNNMVTAFDQNEESIKELAATIGAGFLTALKNTTKFFAVLFDIVSNIIGKITAVNNAFKQVGLSLPTVAAGILTVVAAMKAYKIAQDLASKSLIFFQGITGVGLAKVAVGITAATAAAYVFEEALDFASKSTEDIDNQLDDTGGNFTDTVNKMIADMETGGQAIADAAEPAKKEITELDKALVIGSASATVATTNYVALANGLRQIVNLDSSLTSVADKMVKIAGTPFTIRIPAGSGTMLEMADGTFKFIEAVEEAIGPLELINQIFNDTIVTGTQYKQMYDFINEATEKFSLTGTEVAELLGVLNSKFEEQTGLRNFIETLNSATESLSDGLATALMTGEGALDSFKNFFRTIVQQIISDALKMLLIIPILEAIGFSTGTGGVITGLSGSGLLGSFKQTGAGGGNLMSNRPVLVGESGPEIFTPSSSGSLQANGMGTNVTYNINAVDAPSFQALVASDPEFIYSVTRAGARRIPGAR